MTEAEWLTCSDPQPMLEFLGKASDRKLYLFGSACCRRIWDLLSDPWSRETIAMVEAFADGFIAHEKLKARLGRVGSSAYADTANQLLWDARNAAETVAVYVPHDAAHAAAPVSAERASRKGVSYAGRAKIAYRREQTAGAALVRDIFGNPFLPVTINPALRAPKVTTLAQTIYNDRAFDRMPELADALQEAGCDHQDLLSHCRGPGPPVKGCWVVDLLLGKE